MKRVEVEVLLCLMVVLVGVASATAVKQTSQCNSSQWNGKAIVCVQMANITDVVETRLKSWVQTASTLPVVFDSDAQNTIAFSSLSKGSLVLSFGPTFATSQIISNKDLQNVGPEGFVFQSQTFPNSVLLAAVSGNPATNSPFVVEKDTNNTVVANLGLHIGSYSLLEAFGFGFYHPMLPVIPSSLSLLGCPNYTASGCNRLVLQKPRWPVRGWHYHTEHPLELTEVFQGIKSGDTQWETMVPEVEQYYEWLIAQGLNRLEWIILWTQEWTTANSTQRQQRLGTLTELGREFGLLLGADVPIAEKQQHAWYMTTARGTLEDQTAEIQEHIDWLVGGAKFDFISTESGYSEFTHPNCTLMLNWMNIATAYVNDKYNKPIYIKCHCSSGQVCEEYPNPYTNEPINFNFLPAYADPRLGVYAHTVQFYNFTDASPTYGNSNFTYMFDFLFAEAPKRASIYHGETAYWVNFDINVPIFLPVYAAGRFEDLQAIAYTENKSGQHIQGQVNFESGWEWGYWLNNVVTARASWDPRVTATSKLNQTSSNDALRSAFSSIAFAMTGQNAALQQQMLDLLMDTIAIEKQLLIYGNQNGSEARADTSLVVKKNGMGYLAGWDTWVTLSAALKPEDCTQPVRLEFKQIRDPLYKKGPNYKTEVEPLLYDLMTSFQRLSSRWTSLYDSVSKTYSSSASSPSLSAGQAQKTSISLNSVASDAKIEAKIKSMFFKSPQKGPLTLLADLRDAANMTALRATQIYGLYQYVYGSSFHVTRKNQTLLEQQIALAENAIVQAQQIVTRHFDNYPVGAQRVATWRPENPTAYRFGYLWTAQSLYYYWRDYSTATNTSFPVQYPCFMNRINPEDIGFGTGPFLNVTLALQKYLEDHDHDLLAECLTPPSSSPQYPETQFPLYPPSASPFQMLPPPKKW